MNQKHKDILKRYELRMKRLNSNNTWLKAELKKLKTAMIKLEKLEEKNENTLVR